MAFPYPPAEQVAEALLAADCVVMRSDEPFRIPSGWASPAYMDCRRLISFPALRRDLVARGVELLKSRGCLHDVAYIAGAEASGIAFAAWIAEALDLPLLYVRKKSRGCSQIEGVYEPGRKALLIDDVMAGGHSMARFLRALAAAGLAFSDAFVIFDYATFGAERLLEPLGATAHALSSWRDVLAAAQRKKLFTAGALEELKRFLNDPPRWSERHGGFSQACPPFLKD